MTDPTPAPRFTLAFVPGVTPTKWVRVWHERIPGVRLDLVSVTAPDATALLRSGTADAGFVRLPIETESTAGRLSVIPLYTETSVVVVGKDHVICAADEIVVADLAGEIVLHPVDDTLAWDSLPGEPADQRPETTADAVELVAAGVGVVVVPQSLARLYHRKDLTFRTVTDAPASPIGLAWPATATTELIEELIGIVRGRTVNSSRGRGTAEPQTVKKLTASQKAAAKRARTEQATGSPRSGAKSAKAKKPGGRRRR